MKWRVTYQYVNPHPAGPFRGKQVVESTEKPQKGQTFYAMFGLAAIKTVSKAKEPT